MRKISPKNLLVLFAACQIILLFNFAREQKSLATPVTECRIKKAMKTAIKAQFATLNLCICLPNFRFFNNRSSNI